jgi:hypothetical protein
MHLNEHAADLRFRLSLVILLDASPTLNAGWRRNRLDR